MKVNFREPRAPRRSMTCEIGGCRAIIEASVPKIAAHLKEYHGLSLNERDMEGIPPNKCPWPGCSGRKVATAPIPAHILLCHGPSGLYKCMVCHRHLETRRDTARGHVRTCLKQYVLSSFSRDIVAGHESFRIQELGTGAFSSDEHSGRHEGRATGGTKGGTFGLLDSTLDSSCRSQPFSSYPSRCRLPTLIAYRFQTRRPVSAS